MEENRQRHGGGGVGPQVLRSAVVANPRTCDHGLRIRRPPSRGSDVPALTMRGRYIMREYWTDSDLFLRLTAEEREVYIGLWMLADDAGWMPRDIPAIGAAIYHYEDRKPREKMVRDALDRLRLLGKIESHRCCLYLPAVSRYPRSGRKSLEHSESHRKHSKKFEGIERHSDPSPVPSLPYPSRPSKPVESTGSDGGGGLGPKLAAAGLKPGIAVRRES